MVSKGKELAESNRQFVVEGIHCYYDLVFVNTNLLAAIQLEEADRHSSYQVRMVPAPSCNKSECNATTMITMATKT